MGYVRLKPDLNRQIYMRFGGKATRPHAEKALAKARAIADAEAKHSSVAGDIELNVHAHGSHTGVVMSVEGHHQDGSPSGQVASHLEFGYFNVWAQRYMPGLRIMSRAKYG